MRPSSISCWPHVGKATGGGASVFHDFHPDASAVAPGSRAQVRVSVIVLDDPRAECVVTVEAFNADSGRTAVIVQIPEDA